MGAVSSMFTPYTKSCPACKCGLPDDLPPMWRDGGSTDCPQCKANIHVCKYDTEHGYGSSNPIHCEKCKRYRSDKYTEEQKEPNLTSAYDSVLFHPTSYHPGNQLYAKYDFAS